MSMHLVGPMLTTTKVGKKNKKPITNKRQLEALARHEQWLKNKGLDDQSLSKKLTKNKKGQRVGIYDIPDYRVENSTKLSNDVAGSGAKVEEKRYTGTLIKGIATMHKSNAVPIMNKEQAIEVSTMRRN